MYRKFSFKKNHDLTVDSIIKYQEDLENSRASGKELLIKDPVVRREQFQATKRWNTILSQFFKEMPRKTNRRQVKFYSDSFTGKEASDFLLQLFEKVVPDKSFSLTNAEKFMQLLITKNLIENVRDSKNKTFSSNATLYKFLNDNVQVEIDTTKPLPRSSSLTDLKNVSGSFKEKLLKNKRRSHSFSMNNNPFNTSQTPLVEVKELPDVTKPKAPQRPAIKLDPIDRHVEGQDYLLAWKHLLLKMIGVQSICDHMEEGVYGDHIKWNCTEIGEKGIVKCPRTCDDLPNEIKKAFKTLSEWKLDNESSPNKVFDVLYQKMCECSPIIPTVFSSKIMEFWKYFHRRAVPNQFGNVFFRNDDPNSSFASSSTFTYSSLSSESEGLRYIDDMETPMVRSRNRRNVPNLNGPQNEKEIKERFFGGLQVLLLSLKPDIRRRLNIICRFMKRLQENTNLKLHETQSTQQYLIGRLALCIVDFGCHYSSKDSIEFLYTLVESNSRLFAEPATLIYSARTFYLSRIRNSPAPQPAEFSTRIKLEDYSKQATTDEALLGALDELITNQNLKPSDKKKKLDGFKATYPKLYAMRFPDEKLDATGDAKSSKKKDRPSTPTGKLVQRIRSLTRRDSARSH